MTAFLKRWLATPSELRRAGVLGMNQRNLQYVSGCNQRDAFPLVDNKLNTKLLARRAGIPAPELLHQVGRQPDVERIEEALGRLDEFVIKPAQGSSGKGILVIRGRQGRAFIKGNDELVELAEIKRRLSNIISGLYSLGGQPDTAIVETRVHTHSMFQTLSVGGTPDIRIVVYQGFPIMAMLRLGVRASDGRANLHQGAVGVGLDIRTGRSSGAVQYNRPIDRHPDTGANLHDIQAPDWPNLLTTAARCRDVTGLGYLGVDLVIDAERGPLLLEMNARPGLAIQIANDCGLKQRLAAVNRHEMIAPTTAERVQYVLDGRITG